jgi:hypothetical protein
LVAECTKKGCETRYYLGKPFQRVDLASAELCSFIMYAWI